MIIKSEFLLGRKRVRRALQQGKTVVVSVYNYKGTMRYTDPVSTGAKPSRYIKYRIHIKLKRKAA